MFSPFRSLLTLQLEATLQLLNLSEKLLDFCVSILPQPANMASTMLAPVPVEARQSQRVSQALMRRADRA